MSSRKTLSLFLIATAVVLIISSCVSRRKKNETSKLGKFYHNTTAYYNGYWNAKEIMKESMVTLRQANNDNYSNILDVEDYVSQPNPKIVAADMDKIIDKVSTVAALHEPSEWVDDCYVMMAKAQYLKQDYETSEETLLYFQEEFNPSNPYGRNYKKKKLTKAALKKKREEEKKEQAKEKERLKKEQELEKERLAKERTAERERTKKDQLAERQKAAKEREQQKKQQAKERQKQQKQKKTTNKRSTSTNAANAQQKNQENTEVTAQPDNNTSADMDTVATKLSKPITSAQKSSATSSSKAALADKEEDKPAAKENIEKDKTAYTEGLIWLAKAQIKRQKWNSAETILRNIESKQNLPDDLREILAATYADLYIKQKKYEPALQRLADAAEHADNKQLKARYHFISAQIYQQAGDYSNAFRHFELAKKYAGDFKMEFMAGLNIAKTAMLTGKQSKGSVIQGLQKMLNEDKYNEVKYLIYYTMGEIEFPDNPDMALEYFRQSNSVNSNDIGLKTEIYYSVANMYYGKEKYLDAKLYYDSTLMSLPQTDNRYTTVKRLVDNLVDIATNLNIIAYQDTILYIADLTGDAQKKAVYRLLEKRNQNADKTGIPAEKTDSKGVNKAVQGFASSNFFAYNVNARQRGKEEFNKIWGNRPLVDNWRKGSRSVGIADNTDKQNPGESGGSDVPDSKVTQEEYNAFLRELPNNPIKKKEANDKIMNAMFTLGKLFRDKIENYAKSASTLEAMHDRYGFTPYELDSYYYLYLDYQDLNNDIKAKEYRDKILRKYPESKYASILTDPDFFRKNMKEEDNLENYYKETYALFEKGKYAEAAARIEKANTLFGTQNKYVPKFALLGAMCMGSKEGKDAYIKALSDVIIGYPNTPEQIKAREIMRFLSGDGDAFKNVKIEDVDKIYVKEDDKVHYAVVITYGLSEVENVNVKVSVSEYNKKYFKIERLQLGDASLNREDNSQIILIRKFENAQKAMEYYRKVMRDKEEFITVKNINYDFFPISQTNYRKMLSEASAAAYRVFFEEHYLKTYK